MGAHDPSQEVVTMDILVTESDPGAAARAIERLESAGHTVHRCHEPGSRAFPCAGVVGVCPLEGTSIDVVLDVRARARTWPTPTEDGVTCALRRRVPVVVAGRTALNPFTAHGATEAEGDVVDACTRAGRGPLPAHGELATGALRETLVRAGLPSTAASAVVVRRGGRLRAELAVPEAASETVRRTAEVRVIGALRGYDTAARGVDVGCRVLTTPG
jgi:hypothetical protein